MNIFFIILWALIHSFIWADGFEISLGEAFNLEQRLTVNQGSESIVFDADFKTNGFSSPQYYSLRYIKGSKDDRVEFELIHHKLYVESGLPDQIQNFEITDGYNLLMINKSMMVGYDFRFRFGIGTVVSHPDIMVNGQTNYVRGGGLIPKFWADGYHWSGISMQASVNYPIPITEIASMNIEGKLLYAWSRIPISGGYVNVPNLSFHVLLGYGRIK
tara:strand:+ start:750 stop:1397 length:648 start_codon:yes stop_codon:yes gene_type:complete